MHVTRARVGMYPTILRRSLTRLASFVTLNKGLKPLSIGLRLDERLDRFFIGMKARSYPLQFSIGFCLIFVIL